MHVHMMMIPYWNAKLTCISTNTVAMAFLGPPTKFNSCQYFQLYNRFLLLCNSVANLYRAFACGITRTSRGVQPGPHCAWRWYAGLPLCEAVLKYGAHRCWVGKKGRLMVPLAMFKSTFDQWKRSRKAWPKSNDWAVTCQKVFYSSKNLIDTK